MYPLDQNLLNQFIVEALYEDIHEGDHTSLACIPADDRSRAKLLVKAEGVIAGVAVAEAIFKHVDPTSTIDVKIKDGQDIQYGDIAFYVECNSQALLKAERLVLNTMQRLSGIATLSSRFAFEVEGLPVKILDTRKTTPLIRFLEKWATIRFWRSTSSSSRTTNSSLSKGLVRYASAPRRRPAILEAASALAVSNMIGILKSALRLSVRV